MGVLELWADYHCEDINKIKLKENQVSLICTYHACKNLREKKSKNSYRKYCSKHMYEKYRDRRKEYSKKYSN